MGSPKRRNQVTYDLNPWPVARSKSFNGSLAPGNAMDWWEKEFQVPKEDRGCHYSSVRMWLAWAWAQQFL